MTFFHKVKKAYKIVAKSTPAAVYVGTYAKYNNGDLTGKWLKLDDYTSYDDFIDAAKELHKDEADPELMFQDFEGFPKRYYHESSLDKDLWEWLDLDEDDREIVEVYMDNVASGKATIEDAKDQFLGKYDSESDWAYEFIENSGIDTSDYLTISDLDADLVAQDLVSSRAEDLRSDLLKERYDDVFEQTGLNQDEYQELKEQLDVEEEDKKRVVLERKIKNLAEKTIEEWESQESDDIARQIKRDPVSYFKDELGYDTTENLPNVLQIDYNAFARDAAFSGDVDFVHKNGEVWVFRP